jgi:hypothetical protein
LDHQGAGQALAVIGQGGDDVLLGFSGDDQLHPGLGDDTVEGDSDSSVVFTALGAEGTQQGAAEVLEVRVKEHRLHWRDWHLPITRKRAEHGAAYVDCLGCRLRDREGAASITELTRGRRGEQRTQYGQRARGE